VVDDLADVGADPVQSLAQRLEVGIGADRYRDVVELPPRAGDAGMFMSSVTRARWLRPP
jgi:hypothetical protein